MSNEQRPDVTPCEACGFENPQDMNFCGRCGAALEPKCPSCRMRNPSGFRFCGGCGTPMAVQGGAGEVENPLEPVRVYRDVKPYTPNYLSELIRRNGSALEGERKQVTVLFADVKGSLALATELDDEGWHAVLDRFFGIVTEGIHRFEGTVNQYTGDGVMALFGAPIAHEDHAQRACYAALHLRDTLRALGDELRVSRGISLGVRIGLNCGEVVVGRIGDDLRMDYTAQGHVVGLAQRMEQLAEPGTVLMTGQVMALVDGFFVTRTLGKASVRGVAEPVAVHVLEASGHVRTRLDRSRARGFSRWVGRETEMHTLELALAQARQGHGRVVGVVAEAGTGKSRLCAEFIARCREQGLEVFDAWCPQHGRTLSLQPIMDLLGRCLGLDADDPPATARERIAGRLLLLDPAFVDVLPLLFDFLGIRDPAQPALHLDPEIRQRQLFAFLRQWVTRQSARAPLILAIDDLHWIDAGSDRFVAQLVEAVQGTATLMLLNFRPEYNAAWSGRSWYQQLPLSPLTESATRILLTAWLGPHASIAEAAGAVHARAGGNPFFIEEIVHLLIGSGRLSGGPGAYVLTAPLGDEEVPDSVQAILQARIDRLPADEKKLLHQAAIVGREVDERLLAAVSGLSAAENAQLLSNLVKSEFLVETSLYPVLVCTFRHPLTREVAEATQLRETRRRSHEAVARALESMHREQPENVAVQLAHHWHEAGDAGQAVLWHRVAAKSIGISDRLEEVRHWRAIIALETALADAPETITHREIVAEACWALCSLGWRDLGIDLEERRVLVDLSRRLAQQLGDDRYLIRVLASASASAYTIEGDLQEGRDLAEESLQRAVRLQDPIAEMQALVNVGDVEHWVGNLDRADHAYARIVELCAGNTRIRNAGDQLAMPIALAQRADIAHVRGEHLRALELKSLARVAIGSGADPETGFFTLVIPLFSGIALHGLDPHVSDQVRQTDLLARKTGAPESVMMAQMTTAFAVADGANKTEAVRFLVEESPPDGGGVLRPLILQGFSAVALLAGSTDRALSWAREAATSGRVMGTLVFELQAQVHLAKCLIAAEAGEAGEIEACFKRGRYLLTTTGAEGVRPLLLEVEAKWQERLGDPASAHRLLHEALALYRTNGAAPHARRLAAVLEEQPK